LPLPWASTDALDARRSVCLRVCRRSAGTLADISSIAAVVLLGRRAPGGRPSLAKAGPRVALISSAPLATLAAARADLGRDLAQLIDHRV